MSGRCQGSSHSAALDEVTKPLILQPFQTNPQVSEETTTYPHELAAHVLSLTCCLLKYKMQSLH